MTRIEIFSIHMAIISELAQIWLVNLTYMNHPLLQVDF